MSVGRIQPVFSPTFVPRTSYDSSSRDYSVDDSISKVEYFSNAVLEDTYDQACRSRVRDAELMKNANATIDGVYYRPLVSTAGLQASQPSVRQTNKKVRRGTQKRAQSASRPRPPAIYVPPVQVSPVVKTRVPEVSIPDPVIKREESKQKKAKQSKAAEGSVNIPEYYASVVTPAISLSPSSAVD